MAKPMIGTAGWSIPAQHAAAFPTETIHASDISPWAFTSGRMCTAIISQNQQSAENLQLHQATLSFSL